MRRLVLLVVLSFACHVDPRFATLHEDDQRPVADPAHVDLVTFDSGLRIALLRDPRAQLASVDLRYDVGAADDPEMTSGLALLVAELLADTPYLDAGSPSDVDLTTSLAIDLDRTEFTSTMFDVDGALELEARRLETTCDAFTTDAIAKARERAANAMAPIPPSLTVAVWGTGHPYGHALADPRVLEAATPEQLCTFYRAHYGPSAATLVVTGAFDPGLAPRLQARFGRIARTQLAPRVAIPPFRGGGSRKRFAVWGLAKPTAALVFAMPAVGADDEVMAELALREVGTWSKDLHAALLGGRRGRVLVIALDSDRASDLPKLHDKLADLVATKYTVDSADHVQANPEEALAAAQDLDDPFRRGAALAEMVAAGRPVQRLARAHALIDSALTFHWVRLHLIEASPESLDLVPATHDPGTGIESLADPASGFDRDLAPASSAMPPAPVRAIARPLIDYQLANGLRVVLARDRLATTIDARLIVPVGSRDEPEAGVATRAASELESSDVSDYEANEKIQWYQKRASIQDADVTASRTRFRVVGFASAADWHVWALAFRVTTGRYENGTGAMARWKSHFVPSGATLIVSGGFDPTAMRKTIDTWFGAWRAVDPRPIARAHGPSKPVIELADDGTLELELAYELPEAATASRAAALVLATIAQQRLAVATRGMMDPTVTYDVAERRLVIASQTDPHAAAQALGLVDRELARLRDEDPTDVELERARRTAIAVTLGGELGDSGRARQIEERVVTGTPLDVPDSLVAEVTALSAADVRTAAGELFDRAHRSVALRGSRADGDRVLLALGIDPKTVERH